MLMWAIVFLCLGLIAGVFGFGVIRRTTFCIAKGLSFVFIILFVAFLLLRVL